MIRAIRSFFQNLEAIFRYRARELEEATKSYDDQQYYKGYEQGVYDARHFCDHHHEVRRND